MGFLLGGRVVNTQVLFFSKELNSDLMAFCYWGPSCLERASSKVKGGFIKL